MVGCSIRNCKSRSIKGGKISFFSFPQTLSVANEWLRYCGPKTTAKNGRVCSKHFLSSDYVKSLRHILLNESPRKVRTLKPDALPTLLIDDIIDNRNKLSTPMEINNHIIDTSGNIKCIPECTKTPADEVAGSSKIVEKKCDHQLQSTLSDHSYASSSSSVYTSSPHPVSQPASSAFASCEQAGLCSFACDQPSASISGTTEAFAPPSPVSFFECGISETPIAARQTLFNRHLEDDETNDILNYGSEVESGDSDDEYVGSGEFSTPRTLQAMANMADDNAEDEWLTARLVDVEETPQRKCRDADGDVYGPTALFDFNWRAFPSAFIDHRSRREPFTGRSGPMVGPISNPYEAFVLIWDKPIIEYIARQTNTYAQEYAEELLNQGLIAPMSRITEWKDTNADELYVFFAILLAMGLVVKDSIDDYWVADSICSTPFFSAKMTKRRFQLLCRCLHFSPNKDLLCQHSMTRSQAKLHKIRPIVNHLNKKFSNLYSLGQNIALDESLTNWNGSLNIKKYTPNKAAAKGIKTYEICESHSGYLWRFEVHAGGGQDEVQQDLVSGSTPNLVLRLLQGLEHRGHTVWMHNFYISPLLARVLKSMGYDCVGILRSIGQFVPQQVTDLKKSDMRIDEVCGYTSGDIDLMVWRDQNRVAMISTYHGVTMSEGKPKVVRDYNVCIGGVGNKHQMLSSYPIERNRNPVWYKIFFRHLLNASVFNAYILYKHTHEITHRKFRVDLVEQLLDKHLTTPTTSNIVERRMKFTQKYADHFPRTLPLTIKSGKLKRLRQPCVACKKRRTYYMCPACNVTLCSNFDDPARSCFVQYHIK